MSRVRADKLTDRAATGAPSLTYGAEVPVGYGITGAGGINISGIATIATLGVSAATTSKDLDVSGVTTTGSLYVSGITTVGILTSYESITIKVGSGSTEVATELKAKASTGKAIAMAMVFG